MGMLMTYRPGYYPGDALEDDGKRAEVENAGARGETPDPEAADAGKHADGLDDLTDDELATAYAERVGGNASTRRGYLKALRKAEAESPAEGGEDPENDPEDAESDPEGE